MPPKRLVLSLLFVPCLLVSAPSAFAEPPAPPAEAYAACQSKSEREACTVTFREHTIEGTCFLHPSDQRLFCRPSGPPPNGPKD